MGASTPVEPEKSAEAVAFLALAYHELSSRWSSVGPRLDGAELYDDLEAGDPQLSLVIMIASDAFAEPDWRIVRWLGDPEAVEFGADRGIGPEEFELRGEFEPWRLEAALHAVAAGEKAERLHPGISLPADFALAVARRWEGVEDEMTHWRELGLAVTRETLEDAYFAADCWLRERDPSRV